MDGNLYARDREDEKEERNEARYNQAVKEFRESMDATVNVLCGVFKSNATLSYIDRDELKAILLDDIKEQL